MNLKILKPKKLSKKKFPLFWEEYEELRTEHEFMFFKFWTAPNGKNKQKKYYVEEPHTLSPNSKPNPNSKPLSLSLSLSIKTHGFLKAPRSLSFQIKTQLSPSQLWFLDLISSYLKLFSHTDPRLCLSLFRSI